MANDYWPWRIFRRHDSDIEQPLLGTDEAARREIFDECQNLPALQNTTQYLDKPREWMHIDASGNLSFLTVDKHAIIAELGIHYRDFRFVDPMVATPYPCAFFIRDRALVINLESLRMIITDDQVFVLSVPRAGKPLTQSEHPSADNFFVQELLTRLRPGSGAGSGTPSFKRSQTGIDRKLPYELRALESGLAVAVRTLEAETLAVEQATLPSLKRLMAKISRRELDNVRHAKTVVNKLLTRVKIVRKELEDLLDDDDDMRDMYLGRREEQRLAANTESVVSSDDSDAEGEARDQPAELGSQPRRTSQQWQDQFPGDPFAAHTGSLGDGHSHSDSHGSQGHAILSSAMSAPATHVPLPIPNHRSSSHPEPTHNALQPAPSAPATEFPSQAKPKKVHAKGKAAWTKHVQKIAHMLAFQPHSAAEDPNDISAVESLLENYFMLVDFLLSRLQSLEERIDGCEDQLNIELDHRRNELVALDLIVGAVMAMFAFVSMIGGIIGMNLKNGFEESEIAFYSTTAVTLVVASILMLAILLYARWKRLLFIPDASRGRN